MTPPFKENRNGQLPGILARGGFVEDYLDLCTRYPQHNHADERSRLDFDRIVALFKAVEPVVTASKTWRMVEFGGETIGGWVWTGSLVIRRRDLLDPMMKGVSPDGGESVGSVRIDLARSPACCCPRPSARHGRHLVDPATTAPGTPRSASSPTWPACSGT